MNRFNKIKFVVGSVLWLFIIIATFLVGWSMSFTSIDIANTPNTTGIINSVNVQQSVGTHTPPGQMCLVIYLDNDPTGFWVYRASQNYQQITSQLPNGAKATIYHSERPDGNNYYTAYQIQVNQIVVYSKDEYERKEKLAGRFVALPAAIIMFIILVYQFKKKLFNHRTAFLHP